MVGFSLLPLFLGTIILFSFVFDLGLSSEFSSKEDGHVKHHSQIHEAKNLIDALSAKLHLNIQAYQTKYASLQQESSLFFAQSTTTQKELKTLNKLKQLHKELVGGKTSMCPKFYSDFDFTVTRPIIIKPKSSALPENYTVKLQVNHRHLIDAGLAMSNGNDLRVFYQKPGECRAKEIDRIVENLATTKAIVLFKLQERLDKTEIPKYFLLYGNRNAGRPKKDPEKVYLFYDDFSDPNLKTKWQSNWGSSQVVSGQLEVKIHNTQTRVYPKVAIFVKEGSDWTDVEVELDIMEKINFTVFGPFLRLKNTDIKRKSAWWFLYVTGFSVCAMQPFKNNSFSLRNPKLKQTSLKPLVHKAWTHIKYRVIGDKFSHWVNGDVIHDNVNVPTTWMIDKGTLGFGCSQFIYTKPNCHTFYDNIKVTRYVSSNPTLSLGTECKVDIKKFYGLGNSDENPATSCKQIHDISLHNGQHRLQNGVYWVKSAANQSVPTYCDLANGGWTLVGKISGHVGNIYRTWLIKNHEVSSLANPALPNIKHVSCIDARYMATYHADTVMLASGENPKGIGGKWVQWSLPDQRESKTLWTHGVGLKNVVDSPMRPVLVEAWNGGEKLCYQNKFGISPQDEHGGSYPSAVFNTAGNTMANDNCMGIGVQTKGTLGDGWSQNGNGYDTPSSNSDWLNKSYDHDSPFVTVWLK